MPPKFLYRACHSVHSSGVNSRNGFQSSLPKSDDCSPDAVTLEQHNDDENVAATPWISTTDRLLDAILRAVALSKSHGSTTAVHLAIIGIAQCAPDKPSKASQLRYRAGLVYDTHHAHEFLFRWRIPAGAIVSCLALQTLVERGLYVMLPQVQRGLDFEDCALAIMDEWESVRDKNKYLQQVGVKAAKFALLFGRDPYTEYVGLEAAKWWESRVGTDGWKTGFGRYFFRSFNVAIRRRTGNSSFD